MEYTGKSVIIDGRIEDARKQMPIGVEGEVYEVLRVERGVALFVDEHIERWRNSLSCRGLALPEWAGRLQELTGELCERNGIENCDIRIVTKADGISQFGFVETEYPTEEMYAEGVSTDLLKAMREQPEAKVYHSDMRSRAARQQAEEGLYESLLVDDEGRITEGSRSNVYFETEGKIVTAPVGTVLGGIMRRHVMGLCRKMGIEVVERRISVGELSQYDGAFLSSTPMRILPIARVGDVRYGRPTAMCMKLIREMNVEVEDYISQIKI